jgi:hypothetical protein
MQESAAFREWSGGSIMCSVLLAAGCSAMLAALMVRVVFWLSRVVFWLSSACCKLPGVLYC